MTFWMDAPDWKTLDRGEILAAWRTYPRALLYGPAGRFEDHLREALLAVTPAAALQRAPDDHAATPRLTKGRYALTVAQAVPDHLQDVRLSWVLLAAVSAYSLVAYATLAGVLREAGYGRLAVLWRRAAMDALEGHWALYDKRSTLEVHRSVRGENAMVEVPGAAQARATPLGSAVETPPKSAPPRLSYTPTRVVVRGPIHEGGGKGIAEAYQPLTEPLPLAGCDVSTEALCDALDMEFPWLAEATQAVREDLALRRRAGSPWVRLRPLLLVGPPGTGKTRWARRLAQLSGTGFGEIAGAGSTDNRSLAGTARGWGTANPSYPVQVLLRTRTANPVLVVDEIEKAGGSSTHNGRLHDTLLAMLEPETAAAWPDECLQVPVDLSQISWVCTANSLKGLPDPLVSRLRIERTGEPAPEDWPALLQGLLRDLAAELDVPADALPGLEPDAEAALRRAFETGAPVRKLKAALTSALAYGEAPEPERH